MFQTQKHLERLWWSCQSFRRRRSHGKWQAMIPLAWHRISALLYQGLMTSSHGKRLLSTDERRQMMILQLRIAPK